MQPARSSSRHPAGVHARAAACAALLAAAIARSAQAQALEVSPVTVEMNPGRRAASLTLVNHGEEGGVIQIRPFAWVQTDGQDRLDPTTALAVSPPFATLGPGESQIVRLVLRAPITGKEAAFRVLVDQLPPAAAPGNVRMALRVSMPVFVEPSGRLAPALTAAVSVTGPHSGVLTIRNTGGRRARLFRFALSGPGAAPTLTSASFAYVLAGGERRLPIAFPDAAPAAGATIHVRAESDSGDVSLDAPISPS